MRNIEEIAEEEDVRSKAILRERITKLSFLVGLCLCAWGWFQFAHGTTGKGSLEVCTGLVLLGMSWELLRVFQGTFSSFLVGLFAASSGFALYTLTRLPSFFWGNDPSYWLAIHAGSVPEPPWTPLCYLLGQATCYLLPETAYSVLPELSAFIMAIGIYFLFQDLFIQLKSKTPLNLFLALAISITMVLNPFYWNAGTIGIGLETSLGFLVFLFQRALLGQEDKPWKLIYFLLGLLWSIHPLLGLLGLLNQIGSMDYEGRKWKGNVFSLGVGLTPFLWIVFRTNKFFPSWGGKHPFLETIREWNYLWNSHLNMDWKAVPAIISFGWNGAIFSMLIFTLWIFKLFYWKTSSKKIISPFDFWFFILCGAGAVLVYSSSTELAGPSAPWFVLGLGQVFLKLIEKVSESRNPNILSGPRLSWIGMGVFLIALGIIWLPGQNYFRSGMFFPQQHARNLLETIGNSSIFICEDPYNEVSCIEERVLEPIDSNSVILAQKFLNQRWYVTQVIETKPEILFSNILGPTDEIVKNLVTNNKDSWVIHWDRELLPPNWDNSIAYPTVLTHVFLGKATLGLNPEESQYHLDMALLEPKEVKEDPQYSHYFSRYVDGFTQLGNYLILQGHYSASIHALDRAVKLDPSFQEAQSILSQLYSQKNILEAAQLEYEQTVKSDPGKIAFLMKQLDEMKNKKDGAETLPLLDQIIHLDSELAESEYQLSKIYDQQGKPEESKALLESSLKLNPQQLQAQMTLGTMMEKIGNRIKAEEAFRTVLSLDPVNKPAQVELWKLLNSP